MKMSWRMNSRWKKILGDVVAHQGRIVMMVVAIAIGVASVATISTAYKIIDREINRNYLATRPPSALIAMDKIDERDLASVRSQPGVTSAQADEKVWARVQVGPQVWLPALLFVVPNFADQPINTVRLVAGHWPTSADDIVLERAAMPVANTVLGALIGIQTEQGIRRDLRVAGVVHDASLAPASEQQMVYGYVTPATLGLLGILPELRVLKIAAVGEALSVEGTVLGVARRLVATGHRLGEIRIPPQHHPHWGQMRRVVDMLLCFSILTLMLSAVLTAVLTANFLAPQVRQMGVMKAIGAQSYQIAVLYGTLIAVIGMVAVGIGLPLGILAGRALAVYVGNTLNFDVGSLSCSPGMYLAEAAAGVGVPLSLALLPIILATRRTVREALDHYGARTPSLPGGMQRWALSISTGSAALTLALRNCLRQRTRLALTLILLTVGGALFITSLNLSAAWQRNLNAAFAERHYDVEIRFAESQLVAAAIAVVAAMPGVNHVEPYSEAVLSLARPDGLNVTHTFPDGGHGSLRLAVVPARSQFLTPKLVHGHWIGAAPGVVLNRQAASLFPSLKIGDSIHMLADGAPINMGVVGVIDEHMAGATIYMTSSEYRKSSGRALAALTRGLRISLERADEESDVKTALIERALNEGGLKVAGSSSKSERGRAFSGHLFLLIFTLVVMALLMATVGLLGLASAMMTSVLERTREFAIMRAIGASRAAILSTVICESLFIGIVSLAIAVLLSIPLTLMVAQIAQVDLLGPMGGLISITAVLIWLAITLASAALASAVPAKRASIITVREALAYQ